MTGWRTGNCAADGTSEERRGLGRGRGGGRGLGRRGRGRGGNVRQALDAAPGRPVEPTVRPGSAGSLEQPAARGAPDIDTLQQQAEALRRALQELEQQIEKLQA